MYGRACKNDLHRRHAIAPWVPLRSGGFIWSCCGRTRRFHRVTEPCQCTCLVGGLLSAGKTHMDRKMRDEKRTGNIPRLITLLSTHHSPMTVKRKAKVLTMGTVKLNSAGEACRHSG